jgi:site-specific DNA-methyltransferase (adenine-specific)
VGVAKTETTSRDAESSNFYRHDGPALTSIRDDWRTPHNIFDALNQELHFTVDAAANDFNALLPRYWTKEMDAFKQSWRGHRVFCNPPYGRDAGRWIAHFYNAVRIGGAEIVVALLPARTDTRAFHDYIYNMPNVEVRFLRGRLRFGRPVDGEPMAPAPFPSMICIFRPEVMP